MRNGTHPKMVLTEATGQVEIDVPRAGTPTFEPVIVKKRQRRLNGTTRSCSSLYAHGLATGEISAHFAQIYVASVSKETISRITVKFIEEMQSWQARPLEPGHAAIFIDAIVSRSATDRSRTRPVYAAIGGHPGWGERHPRGVGGTGGEGAKFWMSVLTEIRNRGIPDVFYLVCDGLKGPHEAVGNVRPLTTMQTCIIRLMRNTFRLASRRDWDALKAM